ncbi:MAG: hypothetical protein ACI9DC_001808 [Gammaproteobacteria bacterium]|jgi:hypothetical protein
MFTHRLWDLAQKRNHCRAITTKLKMAVLDEPDSNGDKWREEFEAG